MTLGELAPWGRKNRSLALQDRASDWSGGLGEISPFMRLHQEMNRLFDDVLSGFEAPMALGSRWPSLEVEELDDGYRVSAELPGLDEKDIDVSIEDGVLSIRGEKRAQAEDRGRRVSERWYGRFERRLPLPDVDEAKVTASFDRGVLTIDLPRAAEARRRARRIHINGRTRH